MTATVTTTARPARRSTGLVGQLNREWDTLLADPGTEAALARWERREPLLRGLDTLGGLPALVGQDADGVLLALVRLAQAGAPLAGRAVLQLMLGKVARVARSQYGCGDREEALAAAVGALWQSVATYPVGRRPVRVAANLALETLAGTRRDLASARASRGWLPLPEPGGGPSADEAGLGVDGEVWQVLAAAVRDGTVTAAEARLLGRVYASDGSGSPVDPRTIAAQEGLSWPALRQRCSRSVRRLSCAPLW